MDQCIHCGKRLNSLEAARLECPFCGQARAGAEPANAWRAVARFANLAEVGFFADVLEGHSIRTRVHHQQKFDAMGGHWQNSYELMVSETDVERAIGVLREEIGASGGLDDDEADAAATADARPAPVWSPIIWAVIAGGLGYLLGRAETVRVSGPSPQVSSFLRSVAESAPLHADSRPNRPSRVLRFEGDDRSLVLEEDRNGDGFYDLVRAVTPVP